MRRLKLWSTAVLLVSLGCPSPTLRQRLITGEGKSLAAEDELALAQAEMEKLEPDAAQAHLRAAREALMHEDVSYYPERHLIEDRVRKAEHQLESVKAERARRDLEEKAAQHQRDVLARLEGLARKRETARGIGVQTSWAGDLKWAMGGVFDSLQAGLPLEEQVAEYGQFAAQTRRTLEQAAAELRVVEARVAFLEGPATSWLQGKRQVADGRKEKDRARRRDLYLESRARFEDCARDGRTILSNNAGIAGVAFVIDGAQVSPAAVVKGCMRRREEIRQAIAQMRSVRPPPKRHAARNRKK
ncbi:MAG: hypothetical protein ACKVPX_07830 [Myxococcaceae bacterium]